MGADCDGVKGASYKGDVAGGGVPAESSASAWDSYDGTDAVGRGSGNYVVNCNIPVTSSDFVTVDINHCDYVSSNSGVVKSGGPMDSGGANAGSGDGSDCIFADNSH